MSVKRSMNKQIVIYKYNGLLTKQLIGATFDTYDMGKSQKDYKERIQTQKATSCLIPFI